MIGKMIMEDIFEKLVVIGYCVILFKNKRGNIPPLFKMNDKF